MDQLRFLWGSCGLGILAVCLPLAGAESSLAGDAPGARGTVTGSVVDAAGQGIPDATVSVETDPCCFTEELTARTDSTGAFEIGDVPAGLVRVRAVHRDFSAGGVAQLEVEPTSNPLPVLIVLGRGSRVAGHVYYRDGRPFAAGWVIVNSSNPRASYGGPEPIPLDEDGAFLADHLPPGPGQVYVLALTPHAAPPFAETVPTLSPVAIEPVEIVEGEEAMADITLSDVVVSGRVTRGGDAAAGIRVTVSTGPRRSISLPGLAPPAVAADPPALEATTRDDGSYELVVFGPGPARVSLTGVARGEGFPARSVTVPDTDSFTLDFELAATAVSGVVVDRDTGAPLRDVSLRLAGVDESGLPGAPGRSGPDGRFAIGAEAGDYTLSAERPGRVRIVRKVSVGAAGLTGMRLEMDRGLSIAGHVVGANGRAAAGQVVFAVGADGFEQAVVRSDGAFRIEGLGAGPYALSVGSSLAGFATRRAVRPGPEAVRLTLRPAGTVTLRVVTADGQPVAAAVPAIVSVDGAPLAPPGGTARPTGGEGVTEVDSPAGEVSIAVRSPSGAGLGTVDVRSGETARLLITLDP